MPRKTRDVEAALKRKGFRQDDTHHKYFIYFTVAGKKTAISTYTSQGSKELDDYLVGQMAKQCKIKRKDFESLIECHLEQQKYEADLLAGGFIGDPEKPK